MLITMLFIFLLGFFFCAWGSPFLDSVFTTLSTWLQVKQAEMSVKISETQVKIAKMKNSLHDKDKTPAIGFIIPDEKEDEYDDD